MAYCKPQAISESGTPYRLFNAFLGIKHCIPGDEPITGVGFYHASIVQQTARLIANRIGGLAVLRLKLLYN